MADGRSGKATRHVTRERPAAFAAYCTLRSVTKQKRERKERAESAAKAQRATDIVRRERETFAKKIAAAREAAKTTVATGIVDDVE